MRGKDIIHKKSAYSIWDHPRLCGEKASHTNSRIFRLGSPPPMRGKEIEWHTKKDGTRITPAYAGKRMCYRKQSSDMSGSPPPMRGKDMYLSGDGARARITPAYAGKRASSTSDFAAWWDHPRLCGEKTKKIPKQRYFFHQPASFSFSLQYT